MVVNCLLMSNVCLPRMNICIWLRLICAGDAMALHLNELFFDGSEFIVICFYGAKLRVQLLFWEKLYSCLVLCADLNEPCTRITIGWMHIKQEHGRIGWIVNQFTKRRRHIAHKRNQFARAMCLVAIHVPTNCCYRLESHQLQIVCPLLSFPFSRFYNLYQLALEAAHQSNGNKMKIRHTKTKIKIARQRRWRQQTTPHRASLFRSAHFALIKFVHKIDWRRWHMCEVVVHRTDEQCTLSSGETLHGRISHKIIEMAMCCVVLCCTSSVVNYKWRRVKLKRFKPRIRESDDVDVLRVMCHGIYDASQVATTFTAYDRCTLIDYGHETGEWWVHISGNCKFMLHRNCCAIIYDALFAVRPIPRDQWKSICHSALNWR